MRVFHVTRVSTVYISMLDAHIRGLTLGNKLVNIKSSKM